MAEKPESQDSMETKPFTTTVTPTGASSLTDSGDNSGGGHQAPGEAGMADSPAATPFNYSQDQQAAGSNALPLSGIQECTNKSEYVYPVTKHQAPKTNGLEENPQMAGPIVPIHYKLLKWNRNTRLRKSLEETAGDPSTTAKVDLQLYSNYTNDDNKRWTKMEFKVAISSDKRGDFHYYVIISELCLFDRKNGCYLNEPVSSFKPRDIPDDKNEVNFFVDVAPQDKVEKSSEELDVHIKIEIRSYKVQIQCSELNFEKHNYVNIEKK